MFKKFFFGLVFSLFFTSFAAAKPVVVASIAPIGFFVEQIAGQSVEVISLASGDVHNYEPKPNDMKNIAKAKIFFATGVEFESAWIPRFKANSKDLVVVQTDAKIAKLKDEHEHGEHEHEHAEHEHEKEHGEHAHEHGEHETHAEDEKMQHKDPHVWLNPMLALTQAKNICDALIDAFPENKDKYLTNLQTFMDKVLELDEKANNDFKALKNRKFIVYHPAWAYFAARYDLEQISIEINGKEPKIDDLANVVKLIKDNEIKVIFADPNRSQKSAMILAKQTGAKLELLDPLAKNWLENLQNAIAAIKNAN